MALPKFWTTAIAKALSGDQPCLLSTWISGRHKEKRNRDNAAELAVWRTNHTEQLTAAVDRFKAEGWKCSVERYFSVPGTFSIISGKADAVCQKADHRPLIIDVKSGQPRESDIVQVMVEQTMIPLNWNAPTMQFNGLVIYQDHEVATTPAQADMIRPKAFALLKKLGTIPRPEASPSVGNCRFCDVPDALCGERVTEESEIPTNTVSLF